MIGESGVLEAIRIGGIAASALFSILLYDNSGRWLFNRDRADSTTSTTPKVTEHRRN